MDQNGGVLEAKHAGVVSEGFRTATIVLGIVSLLLLLCLLASIIYACTRARRNAAFNRAPGFNAQRSGDTNPVTTTSAYRSSYRTHVGEAENQALTSSGPPLAAPRNGSTGHNNLSHYLPPPLGVKPKSSMRSPPHYPLPAPAHLGGSNSLNDTLNTSFAGSQVPVAGSVSADV